MRQSRKLDHIKYALLLDDGPAHPGFDNVVVLHNCLPDLSLADVTLNSTVCGLPLRTPLVINAITGGAPEVLDLNRNLALLARETGAAVATGSQTAAFEDESVIPTYRVLREVNPDGIILANLSAAATLDQAKRAVDMIEADALQLHLNPGQELMMPEGDRSFRGFLRNIERIAAGIDCPVIVKETGCGIAREQAKQIFGAGAAGIDVGGTGGTNFLAIEASRRGWQPEADLLEWGIPTVMSVVECAEYAPADGLVVSGGVRTPLDALKALALGGAAVGIAGPALRKLSERGLQEAVAWLTAWLETLRRLLLLTGSAQPEALRSAPAIITGYPAEWLRARGIDLSRFSRRCEH